MKGKEVLTFDPSFISKAGKNSWCWLFLPHLFYDFIDFGGSCSSIWSDGVGRTKWGLEFCLIFL